jgi:alginate O-acetyltransferase complex protein AlgI
VVFNSDIFLFAFFPIVFTLFWLARTRQVRFAILAASGYVFYGYWDWRFCGLLAFSTLTSFVAALAIARTPSVRTRRGWLVASVALDLGILGFFKYYNFFADNVTAVAPGWALPALRVVLPVGISFYTFHTISYIVDVAQERVRPTRNLLEYMAYVALFPQLVAGPIVRYKQIEDDLARIDRPLGNDAIARGLGFFVVGLIKKVVIADHIGALIDPMLRSYDNLSPGGAWCAALGYTFQLYYDFSGYSDMAVGLGHLFGIRIPQNFNAPYRAVDPSDFWRRWHMSLSTWLRDYLYISLGGNRRGEGRTYVNLMITMVLGGLWHGASWTFVAWGAYHGLLLALFRATAGAWERCPSPVRRAITFLCVVVGWVLFRSTSFEMAGTWVARMTGIGGGNEFLPLALVTWVLLGLVAVNAMPETWDLTFSPRRRWAVVYAVGFFLAYLVMNGHQSVFLYYQF